MSFPFWDKQQHQMPQDVAEVPKKPSSTTMEDLFNSSVETHRFPPSNSSDNSNCSLRLDSLVQCLSDSLVNVYIYTDRSSHVDFFIYEVLLLMYLCIYNMDKVFTDFCCCKVETRTALECSQFSSEYGSGSKHRIYSVHLFGSLVILILPTLFPGRPLTNLPLAWG